MKGGQYTEKEKEMSLKSSNSEKNAEYTKIVKEDESIEREPQICGMYCNYFKKMQ